MARCDRTSFISKTRTAAGHSSTFFHLNYNHCHKSQFHVGLFLVLVAIHHEKTRDLRYLGKAQSMNNTVRCFDLFSLLCSVIGQPFLSSPVNHPINLGGEGGTDRQLATRILKRLTQKRTALAFFRSFNWY